MLNLWSFCVCQDLLGEGELVGDAVVCLTGVEGVGVLGVGVFTPFLCASKLSVLQETLADLFEGAIVFRTL